MGSHITAIGCSAGQAVVATRLAGSACGVPLVQQIGWCASFASNSSAIAGSGSAASRPIGDKSSRFRRTRALELQKNQLKALGLPGAPAHKEVSPRRKSRRGNRRPAHLHATDLEALEYDGESSFNRDALPAPTLSNTLVPRLGDRGLRRLLRRPVSELPRTPHFFVKFGAPMSVEDLHRDAPSVFVESRKIMDDVLERRQATQSAPDYVAPDTPFWRLPPKARKKKSVQWRDTPRNGSIDGSSSVVGAVDQLQGIKDLEKPTKRWQKDSLAPARMAASVLGVQATVCDASARELGDADAARDAAANSADRWSASTSQPTSHFDVAATLCSDAMDLEEEGLGDEGQGAVAGLLDKPIRHETPDRVGAEDIDAERKFHGPAANLIASLRAQARAFAMTGVDPDLKRSLEQALQHHPGAERALRLREMRSCTKDFEGLVLEGKASVDNCNELIRAQALQGRMDEAMRTHDLMKQHGYEPDDGTFVSLIMGASLRRDAPLARKLFLKMREQLITATPKVYATLIKAHVRSGDIASGFSLLRKMEDERVSPDVVVYTTLIDGLVNEGKLEKAWEEFHSVRTWKLIQPDEVMFTVMIKACAKAEEAERALNMLDDLRTCGLYPTDLTYGELIHAMASRPDFARKAFDFFNQMKAEDLPLSRFIFEQLLRACRQLGDSKKAREIVLEMGSYGIELSSSMYCHLVGVFAGMMRRPQVTEHEKLQNLRAAWHVVAEARRRHEEIAQSLLKNWTPLLNEAMGVYIAGGFSQFAVDLLQEYHRFGAVPDSSTYRHLLEMFGRQLKDPGRFFALWDAMPKEPEKPADDLYHLALETALTTRSAATTCKVLEELYAAQVFPTPQLADRLAKAARHVIQIHLLIGKFVALNRDVRVSAVKREMGLLQANIDERALRLAETGATVRTPTPEQQVRDKHFEALRKAGYFKRPWLPLGEYLASKQKGGEAWHKRRYKPRPNLLGTL